MKRSVKLGVIITSLFSIALGISVYLSREEKELGYNLSKNNNEIAKILRNL